MKIPSTYNNKKTPSQYAQAFKKVPFDKLPFVLNSLSSYPSTVLKELAPLLSLRLYPVRHDPRFSKYVATFTPYLFKEGVNPCWEKWFNGLTGEKQEEGCMLGLISNGMLQERFNQFPTLRQVFRNLMNVPFGQSIERLSKALCKEGNEVLLRHAMELTSKEINTVVMRELSQRTSPLPSSFIKSFPTSSVDFKDVMMRYGLIKSLWYFPSEVCQSLPPEYIRHNMFSFINPKIYQTQYNQTHLSDKDQQALTDFYRCVFQTNTKAQDFLWYMLRHPEVIINEFFCFSILEASSEDDLQALIPYWEKSDKSAFLKFLEHPSVVRCMLKKEIASVPQSQKPRKM